MTARSWFRKLFARTPRTIRKAPVRCRPVLEAPEDRLAPAAYLVTTHTPGMSKLVRDSGDHLLLAPPAVIAPEEIRWAVDELAAAIQEAAR